MPQESNKASIYLKLGCIYLFCQINCVLPEFLFHFPNAIANQKALVELRSLGVLYISHAGLFHYIQCNDNTILITHKT